MFRGTVRAFAEAHVFPHQADWDAAGMVSRAVWQKAGVEGFLCMYADPQFGGLGVDDFRYDMILIEELSVRAPGLFTHLHNRIVGPYLHHHGTDDQRARFMPGAVSGETILAIAMTEPGAGSDLSGIRTRAVDMGDHWLLNGAKTYISNGHLADLVLVAARTNPERAHDIGLF
ncbi:acyl-CoA dehydrogenase family protein [Tropicibacter naphthalenivorans]|uniref:Acyl-CoA dehydrogenase n=1 Tax=Tropicibacter naphthalenivorans TaxID=441103 RepID=A0A0P1GGY5_9RHOB|nr:acyl-CoA dehydrogenase family protein [Tropicibacter naphthalenivorans]CUH81186.1 Acyl-CoA dehydrogenase [Tropicibacter naphthalenivorans]SMC97573.1 Acyl-CoA dehydrogenase, middle domain [Tropicibacter naphthalenivorans]